ncbi:nucleotide sugar dehydrogenase [Acetohalobium arabaticum]|uniref:Nucleotide sugar dehydrogenase n=1 Tax=Acetohalobium arabaticum (strain ATCC 49924 / DSM 5501 / Z-7288) TaxID=574087 RepID=D9QTB9_ACEAZ|nr:nucleotide sugar dehydrogenase [Acetohalobium arabaticum]ADL13619.1 nucleotide sugar dehydrogenase [Acetohalobium arabaticum DSM 5501]
MSTVERVVEDQMLASAILKDKIKNKEAVIGVIGLGYVGLPLAVEKAKAGYEVIGFDIQQERVDMVNDGENYIGDVVDEELTDLVDEEMITATTDYQRIEVVDVVAICVPTPLDEYYQPNTEYVEASTTDIAKYLHKGMLIILESTTYPGTTEEIVKPILEETGLKCGEDFFVAFSPERVDPGNKVYNTKNTPKVVGGITSTGTEIAADLYNNVLDSKVHTVSSPSVAEMEKIFENTFRNINIALANEMAILCDKMGIDVWEVINAAKTKPYGFMAFYPGPGLGGHCIPIDPFYLTWKAREHDYHTRLIELAGEINNSMPGFVVGRLMKILNKFKKTLNGADILMLGVAYKSDIDDLRESPALKIIDELKEEGAEIMYNDPHIPEFEHQGVNYASQELTDELLEEADAVLIATAHSAYDYQKIVDKAQVVFDTRNGTEGIEADNVFRL